MIFSEWDGSRNRRGVDDIHDLGELRSTQRVVRIVGVSRRKTKLEADKISIDTIAREAGVSASTVSRTFGRPELISAATRERVQAVARRLGYQPNKLARSLATGRTSAIGVLVSDITNPFFPPLVRAVEERAYEHDYALLLMDAGEDPSRETSLAQDHASRVDGLILCAPRSSAAQVRRIADRAPVVLINREISGLPSVLCRNAAGYQSLIEHLHAAGHRRVVYLAGPEKSWADQDRRESLSAAVGRFGDDMTLEVSGPFPATYSGGMAAADAVADSGCTAVVAFDDIIALGVLRRLWVLGIGVPEDVVVVGCDNIEPGQVSHPPLSTVATPIAEAARVAVDLLIERMESTAETTIETINLAGRLVLRESTGPVTGATDATEIGPPRPRSAGQQPSGV